MILSILEKLRTWKFPCPWLALNSSRSKYLRKFGHIDTIKSVTSSDFQQLPWPSGKTLDCWQSGSEFGPHWERFGDANITNKICRKRPVQQTRYMKITQRGPVFWSTEVPRWLFFLARFPRQISATTIPIFQVARILAAYVIQRGLIIAL